MHRPGWRRWTVVGACLGVAVLTGCSTPEPASSPSSSATSAPSSTTTSTTSASSTATGSATTAASDIPEAARANTPEGAQAFTLYFGTVLDQAFLTLTDGRLRDLSLQTCKTCSGAIEAITGYRQKNQRFQGQYAHFTSTTWAAQDAGMTKVLAVSETSGGKAIDANGVVVETFPPAKGNLSVQLVFNDRWHIAEVQGVG